MSKTLTGTGIPELEGPFAEGPFVEGSGYGGTRTLTGTGVPELDELFAERPGDGGTLTVGTVRLAPTQARMLLVMTGWQGQRRLSRNQLMMLTDVFRNGEFMGYSLLSFGRLESGKVVMVDGQHRLEASILAGWEGDWLVRLDWETPARDLYTILDFRQMRRPARVQGAAWEDPQLSPLMRERGMEAAGWQLRWDRKYELPRDCPEAPVRDVRARMLKRMDHLVTVDSWSGFFGVSPRVYRKLALGGVLAVVAETLFALPDEAMEFWPAVLRLGMGMPMMPMELAQVMLEPPPARAGSSFLPRMAARAWNGRDRAGGLRPGDRRPVRLQGTDLVVGG